MHKLFNWDSTDCGVSDRRYIIAVAVVAAAVAAWVLYTTLYSMQRGEAREGLRIVVTFSSLVEDVKALLCEGDEVLALVPSGIDPHEYSLTPQDVEKLKSSDLIVSTAHAPFELRIHELVKSGEISARLLELSEVAGLIILENPATGQPNYHGILLDPRNYASFVRNLSGTLSNLRPTCAAVYSEKASAILSRLDELVSKAPRLNVAAVAVGPLAQYAVEWMGVRVKYLLVREHDLPAMPEDLAAAERALATGEAALVIVVKGAEDTPAGAKALELAEKYGKPVIYVPTELEPGSFLSKIAEVVEEAERLRAALGGG